ncbi:MAG: hypothetical protein IKY61_07410 [Thermoguttaceae bacterium]|nr:hypothetical protein [Thermoguttaceae bacterium]
MRVIFADAADFRPLDAFSATRAFLSSAKRRRFRDDVGVPALPERVAFVLKV